MGAIFTSASSTRLFNSAPVLVATGYPWTMGCWFYLTTVAASKVVMCFTRIDVANSFQGLFISSTSNVVNISNAGGTAVTAGPVKTAVANGWYFAICRFITATNRWLSLLDVDGITSHTQNTTSNAPTTMTTMSIGSDSNPTPGRFLDGIVAEAWYCDTDIQRGLSASTALDSALFRQLAYKGPFSYPDIADDIVEYRSLRDQIDSSRDDVEDPFYSRIGRQNWTMSATPPIPGPHPPLASDYVYLNPRKTLVMI